jgi:hypothetical protein
VKNYIKQMMVSLFRKLHILQYADNIKLVIDLCKTAGEINILNPGVLILFYHHTDFHLTLTAAQTGKDIMKQVSKMQKCSTKLFKKMSPEEILK